MQTSPEFGNSQGEAQAETLKPVEQQARDALSAFRQAQNRFSYGGDLYAFAYNPNNQASLDKYVEVLTEPARTLVSTFVDLLLELEDSNLFHGINAHEFNSDMTVSMAASVLNKFADKSPSFWQLVAQQMGTVARKK